MKKCGLLLVSAVMALSLVLGCSVSTRTYTNPDNVIRAKVGQEFVISLKSNPTTGYSWEALSPASWLQPLGKTYKADEPVLIGSGGVENFRFKALGKGTTSITFGYSRPYAATAVETKTFSVEVNYA